MQVGSVSTLKKVCFFQRHTSKSWCLSFLILILIIFCTIVLSACNPVTICITTPANSSCPPAATPTPSATPTPTMTSPSPVPSPTSTPTPPVSPTPTPQTPKTSKQ